MPNEKINRSYSGAPSRSLVSLYRALGYSIRQKQKTNKQLKEHNDAITVKNKTLEQNKKELTQLNLTLKKREDQVQAANEELLQQQEEIASQYDSIALQNEQLQKANEVIEIQNTRIRQENQNLETAVRERTEKLVEYNQQLEQYAFVTAHNLRSPVARILGLANLLEISIADTNSREETIKRMITSASDLDLVIRDLNKILEVRKNNTDTYSTVDLEEVLEKIKQSLSAEITQTNAIVEHDFSAHPNLYAIKPYIDSILHNLVSNAIKYRDPARTPVINLKITTTKDIVTLTVTDNGLGFDVEKYSAKIFQLYKRFHDHVEGRGIGLFLVKTQVTALNGKISVESKEGRGSTFRIEFNKYEK